MIIPCNLTGNFVPFVQGMKPNKKFKEKLIKTDSRWNIINNLYDQHIMQSELSCKNIPDIVHQVWVGSTLPKKCEPLRDTLINYHPHWKFVFWTDNDTNFKLGSIVVNSFQELKDALKTDIQFIVVDVRKANFTNQSALNIARNPGERSDIIRYEALYEIGGIYLDTDFECLQSFEKLNLKCDFYAGIAFSDKVVLLNGLIGATCKNAILKYCIQNLKKTSNPTSTSDIMKRTGQGLLTSSFFKVLNEGTSMRAVALPSTYFYPWPSSCLKDKTQKIENWIRPESIVVHHWHMSWFKK